MSDILQLEDIISSDFISNNGEEQLTPVGGFSPIQSIPSMPASLTESLDQEPWHSPQQNFFYWQPYRQNFWDTYYYPYFYLHSPTSPVTACANCGTTWTPAWRRIGGGLKLCNACGLYYRQVSKSVLLFCSFRCLRNLKQHKRFRLAKGHGSLAPVNAASQVERCFNCDTMRTPMWRYDDEGNRLCNVYVSILLSTYLID